MGWSAGRGCPLPTEERVWGGEGAVPPPQKFFIFFLVQCVRKIFALRPKGGHRPLPPKYATDSHGSARVLYVVKETIKVYGKGEI